MSVCVIFGGAPMKGLGFTVPHDAYVIAADSGLDNCMRFGIRPHMVVGDFDSVNAAADENCGYELITAPAEKDDTDTMLAVKTAFGKGFTEFILTGVTGGRTGHTMASVGALEYICDNGGTGRIEGDDAVIFVQPKGGREYENDRDYRYVSVFSLESTSAVTLIGLKYEAEELEIKRDFPIGVSNEFKSDSCFIGVNRGKLLVILEKQ